MDKSTARDDLAVVDRILQTADRTLHIPPLILITWGIYGVIVNGVHQARASGMTVPPDQLFHMPLMLVGMAITWWACRQDDARRETLVDRVAATTFGVTFAVLFILNSTAQQTVVPGVGMSLMWEAGFSIALLIVGLHSSRLLLGSGIAMLSACAIAPLTAAWFDGVLTVGWFAGFVVPGIVLWRRKING